jgi:hypothetical protein
MSAGRSRVGRASANIIENCFLGCAITTDIGSVASFHIFEIATNILRAERASGLSHGRDPKETFTAALNQHALSGQRIAIRSDEPTDAVQANQLDASFRRRFGKWKGDFRLADLYRNQSSADTPPLSNQQCHGAVA